MESEVEFNLETLKQLTQQVRTFGYDTAEDPIFRWQLGVDLKTLQSEFYFSNLFLINRSHCIGQLNFTRTNVTTEDKFQLSLILTDLEKRQIINSLSPFRLFLCKYKLYAETDYDNCEKYGEEWGFPTNAFDADKNGLNFKFNDRDASLITVELYEEPLAMMEYRSPYENMVVGKIEKFKELMEEAVDRKFLSVSPRFNCGSPDQLMYVRFWCSKMGSHPEITKLSAALHIRSQNKPRGLPFAFTLTVTIFNQKIKGKDLVYKMFYRRAEYKTEYPTLLAYHHELDPYVAYDTLYYKVVIDPIDPHPIV